MTVEEIKEQYSIRDVLSKYGISVNRAGFCSCPFHSGDRTPSMKIYKDSYHCFACGANGDIFTFIMQSDNLTFKDAFQKLGGTYPAHENIGKTRRIMMQLDHSNKMNGEIKKRNVCINNLILVKRELVLCYWIKKLSEPLSDDWTWATNRTEYLIYRLEYLLKERKSYKT